MKNIVLIVLCFALHTQAYPDNIIIKFTVDTRAGFKPDAYIDIVDSKNRNDVFVSNFMNAALFAPTKKTILYKDSAREILIINYKLNREKCYFLTDGFGREILLSPGKNDTILANIKQVFTIKTYSPILNDSIAIPWFTNLQFDKKHAYIGFFDSLARLHGNINERLVYSFKTFKHDLPKYLSYVNKVYQDRLEFLSQFEKRNYFPSKLKYYAYKEIQYSYYDDLLDPIVYFNNMDSYPKALIDSLNDIKENLNDNDLFENTSLYKKVVANYVFNIAVHRSSNYMDSTHLTTCYNYCKNNLKGEIKDYVLAQLMKDYITRDAKDSVKTVYQDYKLQNPGSAYHRFIDSMQNAYKSIVLSKPLTPRDVLNLSFENSKHDNVLLKDIINKNLVLIDCWATWCAPCIQQIPYIDTLVTLYRDKVQFITLSADQSIVKWDKWIIKDNHSNPDIVQLHVSKAFENYFLKKLAINAIPRFILISKAGKILNEAMPIPSVHMSQFKKIIDQYLNEP